MLLRRQTRLRHIQLKKLRFKWLPSVTRSSLLCMASVGSFYQNIRSARTTLRDIGRIREIAGVLVRHGFGHVVQSWRYRDEKIVSPLVQDTSSVHQLGVAERLTIAAQELGPTFVKLGQILSTRSDLIPQEWCNQLAKLQDNVEPIPVHEAREVIETELGSSIRETFATFVDKPLASASIAQVHRATLMTGEQVVVKVRRPSIASKIQSDMSILYWVARQMEDGLQEAQAFNPVAIVSEFEKSIMRELNLKHEVSHLQRFQNNFTDWEQVHVPQVYPELCTPSLMVMEFLNGVKITDAPPLGHDMPVIANDCVRMIFKMVFEDGFFHGDLHPGNLLVLQDGRIGLIDFGLVGRMSQSMKDGMAELLLAIVSEDYERVARAFYALSIKRGSVDYEAYEQDVTDLMIQHFQNSNLSDIDFGQYLQEIVEGAIRHNLSVPPNYTMFFKAIMTVEGIGKQVSPDLDLISACKPYVQALVAERFGPDRVMREATRSVMELSTVIHRLPNSLNTSMKMIENGYLPIMLEEKDAKARSLAADRRSNRMIVTGIGFSFLAIGGLLGTGILESAQATLGWSQLPFALFSLGCGAIGTTLLTFVLLKILFERNW